MNPETIANQARKAGEDPIVQARTMVLLLNKTLAHCMDICIDLQENELSMEERDCTKNCLGKFMKIVEIGSEVNEARMKEMM